MSPLISRQQVADLLGIHINTLYRISKTDPTFPRPYEIGPRTFRWSEERVADWLEAKRGRDVENQEAARQLVAEVYR